MVMIEVVMRNSQVEKELVLSAIVTLQGLPGPPGEKGETGDVGPLVSFHNLTASMIFSSRSRLLDEEFRTCNEVQTLCDSRVLQDLQDLVAQQDRTALM